MSTRPLLTQIVPAVLSYFQPVPVVLLAKPGEDHTPVVIALALLPIPGPPFW